MRTGYRVAIKPERAGGLHRYGVVERVSGTGAAVTVRLDDGTRQVIRGRAVEWNINTDVEAAAHADAETRAQNASRGALAALGRACRAAEAQSLRLTPGDQAGQRRLPEDTQAQVVEVVERLKALTEELSRL